MAAALPAPEALAEQLEQFLAVFGLAGEEGGEPLEQRWLVLLVVEVRHVAGEAEGRRACGGWVQALRRLRVARGGVVPPPGSAAVAGAALRRARGIA